MPHPWDLHLYKVIYVYLSKLDYSGFIISNSF